MSTPVPTRFSDEEIATIDDLIAHGHGDSRSAIIRRALSHFADTARRAQVGVLIADSYRSVPQSADDDDLAMASAIALTEAEPW